MPMPIPEHPSPSVPTGSPTLRLAHTGDVDAIQALMERAISHNQREFLTPEQIHASRALMGLDTQLIDDGTYLVATVGARLAGCGGWSRRATLYGNNHTAGRSDRLLVPGVDAARIRAMYTDPDFVRMGIGSLILKACERAAKAEGFDRLALAATLSGVPLYLAFGFIEDERRVDAGVPLVTMTRMLG